MQDKLCQYIRDIYVNMRVININMQPIYVVCLRKTNKQKPKTQKPKTKTTPPPPKNINLDKVVKKCTTYHSFYSNYNFQNKIIAK